MEQLRPRAPNELLRVQEIHTGAKSPPPFSAADMTRRMNGLRGILAEQKLDAAILTSYHNICYFSGFLYCSFGRRYALVVTDREATLVSAAIDTGQPWRRSVTTNITYTDWRRDNYLYALQSLLASARRIGIEQDQVSLDLHRQLEEAFPDASFADVGVPTMWLRTVKSAEEVALIRNGARIADLGGHAVRAAIAEGVPEYEIALAGTQAIVRAIAATYPDVELMDSWVWFQSGLNTDGAHNPVTSRRLRRGDILSLNCFPMIAGYYTALERTLFLGQATEEQLRIWQINCDIHRRGLEILRPGKRCGEIAAELNEIYRAHDLLGYRSFGYGHSFGVLCHYYGREAGVELREDVDTVLKPGMVVSMEPMLSIPEGEPGAGGYREHDILVLTEIGAENLTSFPFGPEYNIVA